jgi:hypothetical protein
VYATVHQPGAASRVQNGVEPLRVKLAISGYPVAGKLIESPPTSGRSKESRVAE